MTTTCPPHFPSANISATEQGCTRNLTNWLTRLSRISPVPLLFLGSRTPIPEAATSSTDLCCERSPAAPRGFCAARRVAVPLSRHDAAYGLDGVDDLGEPEGIDLSANRSGALIGAPSPPTMHRLSGECARASEKATGRDRSRPVDRRRGQGVQITPMKFLPALSALPTLVSLGSEIAWGRVLPATHARRELRYLSP